jgi:light-regulated signal transduction histidine kinase (bacteriophytochrome)
MPPQASRLKRYGAAVLLVAVAAILDEAIRPVFAGRSPLALFTIAATLAAAMGGLGPGLVATALSIVIVKMMFATSVFTLIPEQPGIWFFAALMAGFSGIVAYFRARNAALADAKQKLESANRELAHRAEKLGQSNDELKRFAYALSHDLQNPLRIIGVFTDKLERSLGSGTSADVAASMNFIRDGVQRSQEMIRSLLEYSISAHETMVQAPIDLNPLLDQALADLRTEVEECHAHITHDPLPVVRGDGPQLRRVFLNLLSNAIKYRGDRTPEIHVSARRADKQWIISVRDNGIGIEPEYTEKIFGIFERLHSASRYEGSGIGLATCRAIVDRHGGRIWVESEPGRGSTFQFSLPQ